ncbi:hypothetical protein AB1Y20_011734 [Prymnesium parvum]|uniref:PDZ domain-containing protein n=1 Tax=Prymnesium parvum TaxID=97485 RepID=A0AB34IK91_PRYPA
MLQSASLLLLSSSLTRALVVSPPAGWSAHLLAARTAPRHPLPRAEFGQNCYEGSLAPLPANVYEVLIERPLGIGFEEDGPIFGKSGVSVSTIVPDSNAARGTQVMRNVGGSNAAVPGKVEVGDRLVGVTAIQVVGAKWERKLFDCRKWGFETVADAIGSNEDRFISNYVILQFERPEAPPEGKPV